MEFLPEAEEGKEKAMLENMKWCQSENTFFFILVCIFARVYGIK